MLLDYLGVHFKRPITDLMRLRQRRSLSDFNVEWDLVIENFNLPEDIMVDAYLSDLKSEIERVVRIFNPRTLMEARRLAHMQENFLEKQRGPLNMHSSSLFSLVSNSKPLGNYKDTLVSTVHSPVAVPPSASMFPAFSPTQDDNLSSKEVPLECGSPDLYFSSESVHVEIIEYVAKKEKGDVWQQARIVPNFTWLENEEFEKSKPSLHLICNFKEKQKGFDFDLLYPLYLIFSYGNIGYLLNKNAPTRHMHQVWFKGKLMSMLIGSNMLLGVVFVMEDNIYQLYERSSKSSSLFINIFLESRVFFISVFKAL